MVHSFLAVGESAIFGDQRSGVRFFELAGNTKVVPTVFGIITKANNDTIFLGALFSHHDFIFNPAKKLVVVIIENSGSEGKLEGIRLGSAHNKGGRVGILGKKPLNLFIIGIDEKVDALEVSAIVLDPEIFHGLRGFDLGGIFI